MAGTDILREAVQLHMVSDRLNALAQRNQSVSEALRLLAKTVNDSAALLEVVVALKMAPENDVEKSSN
jgi:hypothetical protein